MKRGFLFILFSYLMFFFLLPPFQTPDEQGHFELIYWVSHFQYPRLTMEEKKNVAPGESLQKPFSNVIQHTQYVPNYSSIKNNPFQKELDYPERSKFIPLAIQSYNPPLYYIVGSFFLLLARFLRTNLLTQFYFVRFASSLFYFGTVFLGYKTFFLIFKKEKVVNSLVLFFALNPLFIQSGIGIGSDIAATFFVTLFIYIILRFKKFPSKNIVVLGLIAGLASLSRATGLILIPGFLVYLYFQIPKKILVLKLFCIFLGVFFVTQIPWYVLNIIRYQTPIMAVPAFGAHVSNINVSIEKAIFLTLFDFRHVFMHFSGFLGWNEAYPFAFIFVPFTILFILFFILGMIYSWKENINKLMTVIVFSLFLLFFVLDVGRKIISHQGWETGGRDAMLIFFPVVLFSTKGISVFFHKNIDQVSSFLGYFAIWYYYFILVFVLVPRYYV